MDARDELSHFVGDPELIDFRDPSRSREAIRALGAQVWDAALADLYDEGMQRPVLALTNRELRQAVLGPTGRPGPSPRCGRAFADVLEDYAMRVAPYHYHASHPASFSYFTPATLPVAAAADVLSTWANQSVDVMHAGPAAALIEEEVVTWLTDLMGFGAGSGGILTSGGIMANLIAMLLARDVDVHTGRARPRPARARIYASDQAHFSIARALRVAGLDPEALVVVPTDEAYRMDVDALAAAIERDRAQGCAPIAVVATAGTTSTGSVDPLASIAEISSSEGLWLHVDAAYGAGAMFSPSTRSGLDGIARADSITVDPHKWMLQPVDIGALLVRRRDDLRELFGATPEYYRSNQPEDEPLNWFEYSLEGTRRFRGLKLWMTWHHMGSEGMRVLIERNVEMARFLADRVKRSEDFELATDPPDLSIVCFRHLPGGLEDPNGLDAHQTDLQRALEVSGRAWVSTTVLRDRVYLRAGVMNHMTTREDIDALLEALRDLARDR